MRWIELEIKTTSEASDAICEKLIILGADGVTVEDPNEIASIINAPDSLSYADEGYVESLGNFTTIKSYFAELSNGIRLGIKEDENRNFESTDVLYQVGLTRECSIEELLSLVTDAVAEVGLYLDIGENKIIWHYVDDQDWANCWKKYYQTFKLSDRIVVSPSWEEYAPKDSEILISLDPGSAFGTGTHATTAMCASLLDLEMAKRSAQTYNVETIKNINSENPIITSANNNSSTGSGVSVLDLGCGSGILSVVAAKLGATSVDAVDIDQIAVNVAIENCNINGVSDVVNCFKGELKDLKDKSYDIVVANIIADVIAVLSADALTHLNKNGVFITSGIINTKKDRVLDACIDAGFILNKEIEKDDWVAFVFKAKQFEF